MDKNTAILLTNLHELANAKSSWYEGELSDYSSETMLVTMSANADTLMDIWNNAVGIKLGSDPTLAYMSADQLFNYAVLNNLLITDAKQVYEKYGFSESQFMSGSDWTVKIVWDIGSYQMKLICYKGLMYSKDINVYDLVGA